MKILSRKTGRKIAWSAGVIAAIISFESGNKIPAIELTIKYTTVNTKIFQKADNNLFIVFPRYLFKLIPVKAD
jgi:hypothetical protein